MSEINKGVDVSVLVACFNQQDYIGRCLQSVVDQQISLNLEIIVADDSSMDETPTIIGEFQRKYGGIIKPILNDKNLGINHNYFNALKQCTGKYIFFCEGDDYWTNPQKITDFVSRFEKDISINVLFSRVNYIDVKGAITGQSTRISSTLGRLDVLRHSDIPGLSSTAVRNNFTEDLSEWFIQCSTPDSLIYMLSAGKTGAIKQIDRIDSCYRLGSGLWSQSKKIVNEQRNLKTLNVLSEVFTDPGEQKIINRRRLNLSYSLAIASVGDSSTFKIYLKVFKDTFSFTPKNFVKYCILRIYALRNLF